VGDIRPPKLARTASVPLSWCPRRGQIAGQRSREAVDQGKHVGVLLGLPAREQVGQAAASRLQQALADS